MRTLRTSIIATTIAAWGAAASAQVSHKIETLAGGGPDQLPKLETSLGPRSMAVDAAGNLYLTMSCRVYRIGSDDILRAVAGDGICEFSGDGGPASLARTSPSAIDVDGAANLFVVDSGRVRRIDAVTGIISTVAGDGAENSYGDGGLATDAALGSPRAIKVDAAGNLFIADILGNRVRRVDASTGIITTVAGNGSWGFAGDGGPATSASLFSVVDLAIGQDGSLLLADSNNNRVRRVDSTGIITTIAGNGDWSYGGDGGPALQAGLGEVTAIALDAYGRLLVTNQYQCRLRRVDATGVITTIAGTGEPGTSGDGGPAIEAQVCVDDVVAHPVGNLYVAGYGKVRLIDDATGIIFTFAGNGEAGFGGDGYPGTQGQFGALNGIAVIPGGDVVVTDLMNERIRRIEGVTTLLSTVAGNGEPGFAGDDGPATESLLFHPAGIASDAAGNVYFADRDNHRIRRIDAATGVITTVAGNGGSGFSGDGGPASQASLKAPGDVGLDGSGFLYIADSGNHRIRRVEPGTGIITTVAGNGIGAFAGDGGPATSASLWSPQSVELDSVGRLYIEDEGNRRIRRVGTDGSIATVAGSALFHYVGDGVPATATGIPGPLAIAVTPADRLLLLTRNRLCVVDAAGIITTLAGDGMQGFVGDGGPASLARFSLPLAVDVDASGTIFVADQDNSRVRRIDNAPPTASIGGPYSGFRNQAIGFDALDSADADGDPLHYQWDFGDGSTGSGATPAHAYSSLGSYTVSLVVDDRLTVATSTTTVTISNQSPNADAGPDQTLELPGSSVTLSGSGSDADGDTLAYEWRDQTGAVVATTASFTISLGLGAHDFTLTVDDGFGGSATDAVRVVVQDTTAPSVAVTAPNGVEIATGIPTTIEWTASDNGTLTSFDVLFSSDGGTNFSAVPGCGGLAGSVRSCVWTSPGPATAQGRIRVVGRDASNNLGAAESSLTIAPPAITVTAPNTLVEWAVGSLRTISWNHNLGPGTNVKIEVSRNGGGTWTTIVVSTPNTGSYPWQVTGSTTTTARIRVSWTSNLAVNDASDVNFKIATGKITVIVPNTAVTWDIGTTQTISWSHNLGPSSSVKIEVSRNAGNNYTVAAASVPNSGVDSGTYDWVVTGPATNKARIKVTWTSNTAVHDRSDVNFVIQ